MDGLHDVAYPINLYYSKFVIYDLQILRTNLHILLTTN